MDYLLTLEVGVHPRDYKAEHSLLPAPLLPQAAQAMPAQGPGLENPVSGSALGKYAYDFPTTVVNEITNDFLDLIGATGSQTCCCHIQHLRKLKKADQFLDFDLDLFDTAIRGRWFDQETIRGAIVHAEEARHWALRYISFPV